VTQQRTIIGNVGASPELLYVAGEPRLYVSIVSHEYLEQPGLHVAPGEALPWFTAVFYGPLALRWHNRLDLGDGVCVDGELRCNAPGHGADAFELRADALQLVTDYTSNAVC
jgi:single-stranded DNA-binding protein